MTLKEKMWVALAAFFMALVVSPIWAHAKTDLSPAQVTWWCHDKEDAIQVIQTPMRHFGPLMLARIAAGKCGGTFYDYHYVFYPSATHENYADPKGDEWTLIQGVIMPTTDGGYEVFTARKVKKEDSAKESGPVIRDVPGHRGWLISDETL